MVQCKFCRAPAVIMVPFSKMPLCKKDFLSYIENRVKKTIEEYHLIDASSDIEKVLIGLSGGKDSQTLLTILHHIYQKRVRIEALYIDVGIAPRNYGHDSEVVARKLCEQLDIPFHVFNVKEDMQIDLDDIHELGRRSKSRQRRKSGRFRGECSYCGLIKRYYMNRFALENGFTKVATGHNLTDEATQLLSNFFNVDMELMSRAGPTTVTNVKGLIPRVKPLFYIYEEELIKYAYYAKVDHLPTECAYATDSPMVRVKKSLEQVERFRRGNMMRLVRGFQKKLKPIMGETIPEEKQVERQCKECGMATYLEICSFCKTKERLKNQIDKIKSHNK